MTGKVFEFDETDNPDQLRFFESRDEISGFTGGFGNGKTAVLGLVAIVCAMSYENGRFLVGRATRPKLEDSTKPELMKWLPSDEVTQWPSERKNNIKLTTGSTIEFRHIRQEGKGKGEEQSNLLSATYDGIFVDQIDDPEFGYKDFADLIGRLRGTAKYIGDDKTMPLVGPQFFRFTANPTRNWLFREVVNPYFIYRKTGLITEKLLIDKETRKPIVSVYNAPTHANQKHTGKRYAQRMEIVFRGAMGKRFINADWGAYEGLVYPDYDETVHSVQHERLVEWIKDKIVRGEVGVLEGYDFGQTSPSCYILAFVDELGNVFEVDGFYGPNLLVKKQADMIKEIRNRWGIIPRDSIFADPDIFKAKSSARDKVGVSIAEMFAEEKIDMQRGSNAINAGISKVSSYLQVDKMHKHPIHGTYGAPRLFISTKLEWCHNEFADYYWNKNTLGQNVDKPRDVNDHAMDTTKYLFSKQAQVIGMVRPAFRELNPAVFAWHERPDTADSDALRPRHM